MLFDCGMRRKRKFELNKWLNEINDDFQFSIDKTLSFSFPGNIWLFQKVFLLISIIFQVEIL
jgi:hypothetical protein